jgi:hypothetical protein
MRKLFDFVYADHEVTAKKYAQLINDRGGTVMAISLGVAARFCIWFTVPEHTDGTPTIADVIREVIVKGK